MSTWCCSVFCEQFGKALQSTGRRNNVQKHESILCDVFNVHTIYVFIFIGTFPPQHSAGWSLTRAIIMIIIYVLGSCGNARLFLWRLRGGHRIIIVITDIFRHIIITRSTVNFLAVSFSPIDGVHVYMYIILLPIITWGQSNKPPDAHYVTHIYIYTYLPPHCSPSATG